MDKKVKQHSLSKSELVEKLPLACCDETAAVEFLEEQRWRKADERQLRLFDFA